MEPLLDGEDFGFMSDALAETSGMTDNRVRLKRFNGWTGGSLDGVAPSPTYIYVDLKLTVENVTSQEIYNSGGMLTLGDIKVSGALDFHEKLEGNPDTGAKPQEADVLLYQGFNWYMVGKVEREIVAGGLVFSRATWRRT